MPTEENSGENFFSVLAALSGHIKTSSPKEEESLKTLQENLSAVIPNEDISSLKNNFFSFESSDMFFPESLTSENNEFLSRLAADKEAGDEAKYRIFVRDVPVRSTQIKGSVPIWASGAALEKSVGPFVNKDNRNIWFDFYKIKKLIALYIQGQSNPAILFNVSLLRRFIIKNLPPVIDPENSYKLTPDTVWIYSKLLAPDSPAGFYTGLKIKGGTITLSNTPSIIDGKLTVSLTTLVNVELELDGAAEDITSESDFGVDARNVTIGLPEKIRIHFTGMNGKIDEVSGRFSWNVYNDSTAFRVTQNLTGTFNSVLNRVLIPLEARDPDFNISQCLSPFNTVSGTAQIIMSAWALPSGSIDITKPTSAAGIGGIAVQCEKGISVKWQGLKEGTVNLKKPFVIAEQGRIGITDLEAGNKLSRQEFKLYKDEQNKFGTSVKLQFSSSFPFYYNSFANGNEALLTQANTNPLLDRPVKVCGRALDIHTKSSYLLLAASDTAKLIYLYDDNILFDNYNPDKPKETLPKPISLALNNAVFKVTPVNGCLLFGQLTDDYVKVKAASMFLTFGMYAYLPTLPDPYAANLNRLRDQFRRTSERMASTTQPVWLWLVCHTNWMPDTNNLDKVNLSFHFAPLQNQFQLPAAGTVSSQQQPASYENEPFVKLFTPASESSDSSVNLDDLDSPLYMRMKQRVDIDEIWQSTFRPYLEDVFALLDVSSNADQWGVSFATFGRERMAMMRTYAVSLPDGNQFPIQVQGMDVVTRGIFAKAFMAPQISWEPVMNLTDPNVINPSTPQIEPPLGPNYYPNDGGPTKILNSSVQFVPLAPIPLTEFILDKFANEANNVVAPLFTLPWGMRAIAVLKKNVDNPDPEIENNSKTFPRNLKGGIQLQFNAGTISTDKYPLFHGGTIQLNNILNVSGLKTYTSNLGDSVAIIFNNEFKPKLANLVESRGVPLTRIDFSGYGSSIFSNWFNPDAQFAQTSQAKFDVFVGRTAHEVIQVRSIIYPQGIRVVRTIILYRSGSGYVYRVDTGWKAESDGVFDFTFRLYSQAEFPSEPGNIRIFPVQDVYNIQPGIINGFFNVKNIVEVGQSFPMSNVFDLPYYVDANNNVKPTPGSVSLPAILKQVEFDCDVEIEGVEQGAVNGRVPAKKMKGFVQLAPMGVPLSAKTLEDLHILQGGSIGGNLDCIIDIGKNGQKMRVTKVDVNNAKDAAGVKPVFVAAARGSVILPKDGSWSIVKHEYDSGDVFPLPENSPAPVIRIGQLQAIVAANKKEYTLNITPQNQLLRIANPTEILRNPVNGTINYGFLQSTSTQKILFLTPSYKKLNSPADVGELLSKTPPLFTDTFRMISSKGIFPNIGNAVNTFGDAIALNTNLNKDPVTDAGVQVWKLLKINEKDAAGTILQEGFKLLKIAENQEFSLPTKWSIIDEDYLKLYVEYKTDRKVNNAPQSDPGKLDFDINSFAGNTADQWKSKVKNLSLVLDLGSFERLMTIKGNFDSKKGSEASFKGSDADPSFPAPQIEFSPVLQAVMDILQILQDLQGEKYGDAIKKGLKIAMSNKAGNWEYKFDASKEIPVVKFPIPEAIYNAPTTPLKLEASLKVGVYFNSALTITNDANKLLPTAGAYLGFFGRLSVMCVSLAAATVYAVGQANLDIGADTKVGPTLRMKFGFGAQITVGLPVVANVSVMYVVGVEIYMDSTQIAVSAFLLFQGHADILGGIVSITITIEAKGTVKRIGNRTDCSAQVTFAIEISIFLVINIDFSTSWQENRQIA